MKKLNNKYTRQIIYVVVLFFSIVVQANGQSMYFVSGDAKIATQLSDTEYALDPNNDLTCKVENGKLIALLKGKLFENMQTGYFVKEKDKISYYRNDGTIVGYYVPSESRYYSKSQSQRDKRQYKENQIALLYNNLIYTVDNNPVYRIDEGFNRELLGFILFFTLL